jgi:hypothetical protein
MFFRQTIHGHANGAVERVDLRGLDHYDSLAGQRIVPHLDSSGSGLYHDSHARSRDGHSKRRRDLQHFVVHGDSRYACLACQTKSKSRGQGRTATQTPDQSSQDEASGSATRPTPTLNSASAASSSSAAACTASIKASVSAQCHASAQAAVQSVCQASAAQTGLGAAATLTTSAASLRSKVSASVLVFVGSLAMLAWI